MTFEPLIHISPGTAAFKCVIICGMIATFFAGVAYIIMLIANNKDERMAAVISSIIVSFFLGLAFVAPMLQNDQINKNEQIVFANLSKKYQVEMITFPTAPSKGPRDSYPEQSEPQKVMVKVAGKTRPAILTQDEKTSEPTLTDVDSGKPMDDILKAKQ